MVNIVNVSSGLKFSEDLSYRITLVFVKELVIFSTSQTTKHVGFFIMTYEFGAKSRKFKFLSL